MASVSAIIVTYYTGPILDACIDAARADGAIEEIVIVDNGNPESVSGRLRALAASDPCIVHLDGHGNVGFVAGCNLGAGSAEGTHLLFLNPDLVLKPNAAAALLDALRGAAAPAIAGGRLVDEAGLEQRGGRRDRLTMAGALVSFLGLSALGFRDPMRHRDKLPDAPMRVGAVSGAMMAMSRADFETLSGFDADYFLHVEDFDLCRRAEEAGGAVIFQPAAEGVHAAASSVAAAHIVERHKARGFARYFRKFARSPGERVIAALVGGALGVILPLRARFRRQPRGRT